MPFDTKTRADYVELINNELDSIVIENMSEFTVLADALETFLHRRNPNIFTRICTFFFSPAAPIHERIAEIQFYLNHPQEYVRLKEDYAEYQNIIIGRIKAKIKEFRAFNAQQRLDYMHEQQQLRMAALTSQQQLMQMPINAPDAGATSLVSKESTASTEINYSRRFFQVVPGSSFIDGAIRGMTEHREETVRLLISPGS